MATVASEELQVTDLLIALDGDTTAANTASSPLFKDKEDAFRLTPVTFAPGFSSSAETITLQVAV